MFDWISSPEAWVSLATLTALEIVLGIDNIIFISILVGRLPAEQRARARFLGLGLAMVSRILLLLSLSWLMRLTAPIFTVLANEISGRDIILIGGGLFLIAKSVMEVHNSLEGGGELEGEGHKASSFFSVLIQIAVIDIVFSLDSVITAVGLADHVPVMIIAIMLSVCVMMLAAKSIGDFVDAHPTVKMLALSFLILVGMTLVGEGFDLHIPKGYVYFAMAFSIVVEMINIRLRKKSKPVQLRKELDQS
ncbi:MAG: TerC family protein [Leptospirales bacterium]|nr:TerC family protein [Leptospirales bacterium]